MPYDVVGRAPELAAASDVLARAANGPAGLHLCGEPGVGKTSLLRAAAAEARALGYVTLVAAGGSDETDVPYGVLADLVAGAPDADVPDVARATLDALLHPGVPMDRRAVSVAVGTLLTSLAEAAPVAVVVDDL